MRPRRRGQPARPRRNRRATGVPLAIARFCYHIGWRTKSEAFLKWAQPPVGPRCHELRIQDEQVSWRVVYRIDPDAIVVAAVFVKKTRHTPQGVLEESRHWWRRYDAASGEGDRR